MDGIIYLSEKEKNKIEQKDLEFCSNCEHCDIEFCVLKKLEIKYPDKPINCFYYELSKEVSKKY